jgi:hypothetical protein
MLQNDTLNFRVLILAVVESEEMVPNFVTFFQFPVVENVTLMQQITHFEVELMLL